MTAPIPPGPDPQGTHHWVISVKWPIGPGQEATATYRSTITPAPGQTRAEIYESIRDFVMRDATSGQPPTVLFFSLEPNQLGGPA